MAELLQTLSLGLLIGGVYALLASGLTLIFGVMRVINIAHGALLIVGAFITYSLWDAASIDPLIATVIVGLLLGALGWGMYNFLIRPISDAPVSTSVLLTFGVALLLEGLMGVVWGNTSHAVRPAYFNQSFDISSLFLPKAQVYGGMLAVLVLGLLYAVLTRTWLGRAIRASSINPRGAELVGVNVGAVAAITFAIGVACAGAGGSIASVLYPFVPGSHYQWISRLLAICVLGGLGSLPGALLGAMLLGIAETMTVTYVSPEWGTAVPFVVVIVVLLLRPQGLLGSRLREDVAAA